MQRMDEWDARTRKAGTRTHFQDSLQDFIQKSRYGPVVGQVYSSYARCSEEWSRCIEQMLLP